MGRTFEALERAKTELKRVESPMVEPHEPLILTPTRRSSIQVAPGRIHDLKSRILSRQNGRPIRTILLTGTGQGSGTSTTAASLATSLASDFRHKVLLVDANLRTPGLHEVFQIEPSGGIYDVLTKEDKPAAQFQKVGPGKLFLMPSGVYKPVSNGNFNTPRFNLFLETARKNFDYIIIDSAPLNVFPDTEAICAKVDGVVLVITYGKTRRQVALRGKRMLEDAGAFLLGVVINRRKFYIPDWLYKRL
jgi:capsular exopolysaccharide synthesis family protein